MREVYNVSLVSHVIQLATAPVFLLAAVGTLLAVMTNRLGRIIDRSRNVENMLENMPPERGDALNAELAILSRRAKIMDFTITLFTSSALLICMVIAVLFLGDFLIFNISTSVAMLFIIAMAFLILGLLGFLREIFIATGFLRVGHNK
jgi:hypothetical protein